MLNVFELQTWMVRLGYSPGLVDGIWGRKSKAAAERMVLFYRGRKLSLLGDIKIAAEQIIMREIAGLQVGVIDGIAGPQTEKARAHWLQGRWRNALDEAQVGDRRMPAAVRQTWPLESGVEEFFGAPGTNQTTVNWPWPLRLNWDLKTTVSKFQCNVKVKESLERVGADVLEAYGYERIQQLRLDVWGGGLVIRAKRGGTKLSMHAYGIALDWDPVNNALRATRETATLAKSDYDPWWGAWTKEGWLSLGKARNFDWMHVQAARLG